MNFNRLFSNSYNLDENQLKDLIKSKKYLVYSIDKIEMFKSNLNKLIEKGETDVLIKSEFDLLQKGLSDINQLQFKKIRLDNGKIIPVYLQHISKAVEIPNTEDLPDGTIKEYRGGVYEKVNGEWVPSTENPEGKNNGEDNKDNLEDDTNSDNPDDQNNKKNQDNGEPEDGDMKGKDTSKDNGKDEGDDNLSDLEGLFGGDNNKNKDEDNQQPSEENQLNPELEEQNKSGQLPGNNNYKTLEQHAKETPTEELQRFVQNPHNDDDLKQMAMKELTLRGITLENVESNKLLKEIVEKVEKIEDKLNGGEEEVNQNPESPDKLNQDTLTEYNKTPENQKPHSLDGGNKGEEIKVEGLGEEKRTSSVKPEGSNKIANKEEEGTENDDEKKDDEEGEDKEKKNVPPWLKGKDKGKEGEDKDNKDDNDEKDDEAAKKDNEKETEEVDKEADKEKDTEKEEKNNEKKNNKPPWLKKKE